MIGTIYEYLASYYYMKWVKQKRKQDCFPCSLSMVSGIPYLEVRKVCRKISTTFRTTKGTGVLLNDFGKIFDHFSIPYKIPEDGNYPSVASLCEGNKAIVVVRFKEGGGHALAWNGFKLYDPCNSTKKKISFLQYKRENEERIESYGFWQIRNSSLLIRLASIAYGKIQFEIQLQPWAKNLLERIRHGL